MDRENDCIRTLAFVAAIIISGIIGFMLTMYGASKDDRIRNPDYKLSPEEKLLE